MESLFEDRGNLKDFLEEAELQQYHELFRDILKISKISQLKFVVIEDLAHIGLSKPEQRRYKKIYSKYFPNPYILRIKKLLSSNKRNDNFGQHQVTLPLEFPPFQDMNVKVPTKHIISVEDITINKELGMGQFGVVQQGTWSTGNQRLQVAIKCLGHERMTSNSTEFLKEAAVMHSIEHPNVVRLYGVVLHIDSLMLVTELAPLRSLLECLREISLRPNFPVPNLCEFAEQICSGMTYLENKRLIHRDLAARNILVFSKDKVKISDFGLSRALGVGKDYYQTNYNVNLKLPVAWCAPECILYLRFTSASDVWAFGVCLWEMFTYGFQPWAAFSGQQILEAIDAPNYHRLERPECCPEPYYATMLECWGHEPGDRPKFKDLGLKLREIRPEQMVASVDYQKQDEGRRNAFLEYKTGQIITVLGKESMTKTPFWYGVLPGGACGLFDPNNTKPYIKTQKPSLPCNVLGTLSPTVATRRSSRLNICNSLLRSDVKRHTYSGKRNIERSMISSPQGEVRHTGHVGLDGAYFGDLSFLDPAGCPPRQVVQPYKPSEDLEQMPLINPNSPSHLSGDASSTPPYPLLSPREREPLPRPLEQTSSATVDTNGRNIGFQKPAVQPSTRQKIVNKVKSATLAKSFKMGDGVYPSTSKASEIHEYHEIISDTDTESPTTEQKPGTSEQNDTVNLATKHSGEFSQSLLDEIESMFRSFDDKSSGDTFSTNVKQHVEVDGVARAYTLSKLEKKTYTGTMKPMSAHDEKTLETACAMANEITTRSMNDLDSGCGAKAASSPTEKSKFHFKFPLVTSIQNHYHHSHETVTKDVTGKKKKKGKPERRNFSDEAKSVPDIQASLTEESIMAYTSLIEQPIPSTSMISYITTESTPIHKKHSTMPKHMSPKLNFKDMQFNSLKKPERLNTTNGSDKGQESQKKPTVDYSQVKNVLPLPPRGTKPKLVDKPRHIRKHPLVMPGAVRKLKPPYPSPPLSPPPQTLPPQSPPPQTIKETDKDQTKQETDINLYQNLGSCRIEANKIPDSQNQENHKDDKVQYQNLSTNGVDVFDGVDKKYTNPFQDMPSTSTAVNPFEVLVVVKGVGSDNVEIPTTPNIADSEERSLVKDCTDHVSVEDLLEFADQKPCGRQRGTESDEVRIMSKVFKKQVTPELCVDALDLCDWDVHYAIKILRVHIAAGGGVDIATCMHALNEASLDVVKASAAIVANKAQGEVTKL